jgi:DtxR family Mn-dependent transcriptional regulator
MLRWIRARVDSFLRARELERGDDALKRVADAEWDGKLLTVEGLAGVLSVPRDQATRLVDRLAHEELVVVTGEGLRPTDKGRRRALHLLRAHRLWERFLAERTGVAPEQWHARAERMEHRLDPDATEALATRMGHPLYDPHGDPIPTAAGLLPAPSGIPLTELEVGRAAVVGHLEDEPAHVYRAVLDRGLAPGLRIEALEQTPEQVRIRLDGREETLERTAAAQIRVEPLPPGARGGQATPRLADVPVGESVLVRGLAPTLGGAQRRRLLDLGLVPGTEVTPELVSALGDPVAYRIRGALIALRMSEAAQVEIVRRAGGA